MITKTTSLNETYDSLFDEIRVKSNNNINVDNIESFFGKIEEIAQLDKKFLRLPLDEPMFEINANTRSINVPTDFKSNGLSVQGDHLAETVFFSVDRYFDYVDLSSTDISINWKMGTKTGRTKNFVMSTDILPGYVVFGWPIDKVITEKSGTLTFAVEFRKEENGVIKYDFNTLAANINIKDGLIIDNSIEAIALDNDILSIISNSAFGTGDAAVGSVNWVTGNGLVVNISEDVDTFKPAEFNNIINLRTNIVNGEPRSIPVDLFAEGFVDNSTELRYTNAIGENIPVYLKIPAFEEGMTIPNNQRYYVPAGNENPINYRLATQEEIENWSTEDEENRIDLYIRLAKLNVNTAGVYAVKAQGEKYNNGEKIGAGEVAVTEGVIIPEAKSPVAIDIIASELVNGNETNNYSFANDIGNVVFLDEEQHGSLMASAVIEDFGALQFIWQQKLGNALQFSNMDDEVDYILENSSIKNITAEGKYRVIVNNFKNGTYAEETISEEWIASLVASPIINATCKRNNVEAGSIESFNSQGSMAQRSVTLTIADVDRGENPRGTIEYQWKRNNEIVGTEATITITTEGTYTPIVRNVHNGSIFTKVLDDIFVNDTANDQ